MFKYFSKAELLLYISSVTLITASFLLFDRANYLTLLASLIGATSLIFCAKGNPIGQVLIILFSIIYAVISFTCAYYGEMITYLGMTAPMAVIALISWIKHPYNGNHSEVCVNGISKKETAFMFVLAALVTVAFYFILSRLGTSNLAPSLFSVTTSFIAVYLTFRRSPFFAVAYAANDIVLSRKGVEPIRFSRKISGLYFRKNPYNIDILSRIFPSSILTDLYVKTARTLQRANFR